MSCSVIIPAFHSEGSIAATVQSVIEQSHTDWEIIIAADDGKNYAPILANHGIQHKAIAFTSTGGVGTGAASARNAGLKAAKYRFVVSLDADDQLYADALGKILPYVEKHGAAYSHMDFVDYDTRKKLTNHNRILPAGVKSLGEILSSNIHSYAWVAFDRQAHTNLKWPENIIRWEDVLFFASCCDLFGGMYYLPEPLYIYNRRDGSICNRAETAFEFSSWAGKTIITLEHGELNYNTTTTQILIRYFKSRLMIEESFKQSYQDWPDFMQQNIQMFYAF